MAVSASYALKKIAGFQAFVASLTLEKIITIYAIRGIEDPVPIQAILRIQSSDDEIAIFVLRGIVRVLTVLALRILDGIFWYCHIECMELLEKRFRKIIVTAIVQRVICIAPPYILFIDSVRFLRRVDGNHLLPREITFPVIQMAFIAEDEPVLLSAFRTQRRRRDQIFLPSKFG